MQLFNEHVHVVTSPVALVAPPRSVAGVGSSVGKLHSLHWIRVEVVVHVDGIHVVTRDDVTHHAVDKVATLGQCRVEVNFTVGIAQEPLGVFIIYVPWRGLILITASHTIGINPCMQFHATIVALVNHELQGGGSLARLACEPSRPGLEVARVGSVGLRPNLPNHGIHASAVELAELVAQVVLSFTRSHAGILSLANDVHPSPTKFSLGGILSTTHRCC